MESLKGLISRHLTDFFEFNYYLPIIEKAERNLTQHPDITIECCNSLIQGISKSIILRLEHGATRQELDRLDTDQLFKRSLKILSFNDDVYEADFVRRGVSLSLSISTLRNARGDISHGKAVPKQLSSDTSLASAVLEVTGVLLRYSLATYYKIEIEKRSLQADGKFDELEQIIDYQENNLFNDYLDELYPLDGKVMYSKALYDGYYEDYVLQLDDFLQDIEQ